MNTELEKIRYWWHRGEPEQEKSGEQMEIDLTGMLLGGKP